MVLAGSAEAGGADAAEDGDRCSGELYAAPGIWEVLQGVVRS